MTALPITAVAEQVRLVPGGALGLYYALISLRVGLKRAGSNKLYGTPKEFEHAIRAQGNTGEYLAPGILLLGLLEASGSGPSWLKAWAATFVLLRIGHTLQIAAPEKVPIVFRQVGFLGTVGLIAVAAVANIAQGLKYLK